MVKAVRNLQALLCEFVGTFILSMTVVLCQGGAANSFAYIAYGLTLTALAYAFEHISGAQFNPAITIGSIITKKMRPVIGLLYIIVQTMGGIAGALTAYAMMTAPNERPFVPIRGKVALFAVEFLFTFALVLVQQNVATEKNAREPNSYYGMAIAFAALVGNWSSGNISRGFVNPAIGTGLGFASLLSKNGVGIGYVWMYWVACSVAAVFASIVQLYQNLPSHLEAVNLPAVVPITEFIGTFFVVLTACLTGDAFAVGSMLMVMVYMGDHVCGADYNPAVTLGVALRMKVPLSEYWKVLVTMFAQFLGALIAAFTAYGIAGTVDLPSGTSPVITNVGGSIVFETIWTAIIVYVVCAVMTPIHGDEDNAPERSGHSLSYQGLSIGFVLAGGIFCAGNGGTASGGIFNPALGTALASVLPVFADQGKSFAKHLWIYWIGPFIGSFLGSGLFSLLHYHADPKLGYHLASDTDIEPSFI